MRLSVVLPTHRRPAILRACLAALEAQTAAGDLEVIVVSDGHDPETAALFPGDYGVPVTFLEIEKSHQGTARNRGVERATGDFILFLGDDILPAPDACAAHIAAHARLRESGTDAAVLGFTTWDPRLEITPVMRWLEESGWQFGYPMLAAHDGGLVPRAVQHRFTYTSHLSLPRSVARLYPFREDVSLYGWEDVEWGSRLARAGIGLAYGSRAKALHRHALTLPQSLERMETLGRSAVHLARVVPDLDRLPRGAKRLAYRLLALLPTMRGRHAAAFLRGIDTTEG